MTDLAEFMLARIAEDEDHAREELAIEDSLDFRHVTPRRALAECEAKRRIVALWAEEWDEWHGPGSGLVRTRMTSDQYLRVLDAERVLGLLALPYADHADYREEWRP